MRATVGRHERLDLHVVGRGRGEAERIRDGLEHENDVNRQPFTVNR